MRQNKLWKLKKEILINIPRIYEECDVKTLESLLICDIDEKIMEPLQTKTQIYHLSHTNIGKEVIFKVNQGIIKGYTETINYDCANIICLPGDRGSALFTVNQEKENVLIGMLQDKCGYDLTFKGYQYQFSVDPKDFTFPSSLAQFVPITQIALRLKNGQLL